jgi:hypothetical protein
MVRARKSDKEGGQAKDVARQAPRHPAFGFMKGALIIAPGVDLTEPAWPDWDAYAEKKYGPESELGKLLAQAAKREKRCPDK